MRARHSVRAALLPTTAQRRARSDAPYLCKATLDKHASNYAGSVFARPFSCCCLCLSVARSAPRNQFLELGMTPMQAIQTATVSAADLLGHSDKIGSVQPGKFADIIAVGIDPL